MSNSDDPTDIGRFQELAKQVLGGDKEPEIQKLHAAILNKQDRYHFEGVEAEDFEVTDRAAEGLPYLLEGQKAFFHFNRDSRDSYFAPEIVESLENELGLGNRRSNEFQEDVKSLTVNVNGDWYHAGLTASYNYPERGRTVGVNVFPVEEGKADLDVYINLDWRVD